MKLAALGAPHSLDKAAAVLYNSKYFKVYMDASAQTRVRRIFKFAGLMAALGIVALPLLLAALWLEHRGTITLPSPTGPFAVGRAMDYWTAGEPDPLAPVPGAPRALVAWIWYPADAGQRGATAEDYLPAPWREAFAHSRGALLSEFLTRDLSQVRAHSLRGARLSPGQTSYPVVILRGGASSAVANYATLAEDLASHGYVVVGIDAPYRTSVVVLPGGRVIARTPENNVERCIEMPDPAQSACVNKLLTAWTADISFALDRLQQLNAADASGRFTGRLDMTRVGVFGHSFGGAQAAQFCHQDSRCKAGIDLDGIPFGTVVREGLRQPFMFVLSDQIHSSDPEVRQVLAKIQSIYDRLPPAGRLRILIRGANHFLFSDDGALLKSQIAMRALRMFGIVGIDGPRQLAVTAYCVHTFFDAYLKASVPAPPRLALPLYPEIEILE